MRKNTEQAEASKAKLREWMPEGSKLYFVVRSVAKSGMSRVMTPIVLQPNKEGCEVFPVYPGQHIVNVLGYTYVDWNSFRINGCGMDMGFAVADELSRVLYGKSGAITHSFL